MLVAQRGGIVGVQPPQQELHIGLIAANLAHIQIALDRTDGLGVIFAEIWVLFKLFQQFRENAVRLAEVLAVGETVGQTVLGHESEALIGSKQLFARNIAFPEVDEGLFEPLQLDKSVAQVVGYSLCHGVVHTKDSVSFTEQFKGHAVGLLVRAATCHDVALDLFVHYHVQSEVAPAQRLDHTFNHAVIHFAGLLELS